MFAQSSCLMSGAREERVVIALSMPEALPSELYEDLFAEPLDWPWIVMQAMQHRTICMLWQHLSNHGRFKDAVRSILTKNWIGYIHQICRASEHKNVLWLAQIERVFDAFSQSSIPIIPIKGAALIGDIYAPNERMLGDIDCLCPLSARAEASNIVHSLGFQTGFFNPITSKIETMTVKKQRFWKFNSYHLPKFTAETGDSEAPFLRLSISFNLFDPTDEYSVGSEDIIERSVSRIISSAARIPDNVDTIIILCAHIYREAVSATFGFAVDHWQIYKFSDLRTYVLRYDSDNLRVKVAERVRRLGLEKPYYFAMYYTQNVYGDPRLDPWLAAVDPGSDRRFLTELMDGRRKISYGLPFAQRLFSTRQTVVPGLVPVWSRVMTDGEWW